MLRYGFVSLFVIALASPAFATMKHFVVVDTVKNCSIVADGVSAGLTPLGNKGGYESKDAAKEFLKTVRDDGAQCAGVVE